MHTIMNQDLIQKAVMAGLKREGTHNPVKGSFRVVYKRVKQGGNTYHVTCNLMSTFNTLYKKGLQVTEEQVIQYCGEYAVRTLKVCSSVDKLNAVTLTPRINPITLECLIDHPERRTRKTTTLKALGKPIPKAVKVKKPKATRTDSHTPTNASIETAKRMLAKGNGLILTAKKIGISLNTFKKHYADVVRDYTKSRKTKPVLKVVENTTEVSGEGGINGTIEVDGKPYTPNCYDGDLAVASKIAEMTDDAYADLDGLTTLQVDRYTAKSGASITHEYELPNGIVLTTTMTRKTG